MAMAGAARNRSKSIGRPNRQQWRFDGDRHAAVSGRCRALARSGDWPYPRADPLRPRPAGTGLPTPVSRLGCTFERLAFESSVLPLGRDLVPGASPERMW
jgi:hypothetical protein